MTSQTKISNIHKNINEAMNKKEIANAEKLLNKYTYRLDTIISDKGGQYVTAHWIGGGQKMFYSLDQIHNWIKSKNIYNGSDVSEKKLPNLKYKLY